MQTTTSTYSTQTFCWIFLSVFLCIFPLFLDFHFWEDFSPFFNKIYTNASFSLPGVKKTSSVEKHLT